MPKYFYKPISEKVKSVYLENAQTEYISNIDIESNVRLVIEADSEDDADKARIGFIDIRMWDLDKVED